MISARSCRCPRTANRCRSRRSREGQSLLPDREAFAGDAARNRALYDAALRTSQRTARISREMALTGRLIPAQRALTAGLVNDVFPDKPALLEAARSMARETASPSPFVIEGIKRVMDRFEGR